MEHSCNPQRTHEPTGLQARPGTPTIPRIMMILCAAIIGNLLFAQTFKFAVIHKRNIDIVGVVNYALGAVVFLGMGILSGWGEGLPFVLVLTAAGVGGVYVTALYVYEYAVSHVGIGISMAMMRVSMIIPVTVSLLLGDKATIPQLAGILVISASMPLLCSRRSDSAGRVTAGSVLALLACFLLAGTSSSVFKWVTALSGKPEAVWFLAALFGSATIWNVVILLIRGSRPQWHDVRIGLPLGAFNALSNVALLLALYSMAGTVLFPIFTATVVIINAILGVWLWKERHGHAVWVGMCLAFVGLILVGVDWGRILR